MQWLRRHPRAILATLLFLSLNGALAFFSGIMHPLPKGSAEEFWDAMYRIKLGKREVFASVYPPRDGTCVYALRGFHGESLYRVRLADAERLLPEVRRRALAEGSTVSPKERQLLEGNASVDQLVTARIAADVEEDSAQSPQMAGYRLQTLNDFEVRWGRIRRYWLNIVFEAVFLNAWLGLIVLAVARPSDSTWRKAISAGAAFPLLFLPYFLGYCPWSFTSAGPTGGALYPWMLVPFYGCSWGMTSLDDWILRSSGFPLEPLSQPPGPMMSYSGMGGIAPTFAVVVGVLLGGGVGMLARCGPQLRAWIGSLRRRGAATT